ncbi:MAG TPA: aldehyde dehydrogenase family protein [Vicinamibacterales bacterium]|jgi:aldehyde dehydrogenase (NAD+)|nr:aldehyde dehydrogenase family protein [Vicinamibacterales bacterium]
MDHLNFYIDGAWVPPAKPATRDVINPATEQSIGKISMGGAEDVDRAVKAARKAFETYSRTTREERVALLEKIISVFKTKQDELAATISSEVGAPMWLSKAAQAAAGIGHFAAALAVLRTFEFEEARGRTMIVREPIGVVGMITPWNWPINQIACKVAPALAAGCTIVLKPTEVAPLNAIIFAEILHEAGVPHGVFNLVNGDGPTVGAAIASHPGIDMVSFTGSTRAGVQVAINAAPSVKRVTQELGGKSANIILDDADFQTAVSGGVTGCFMNSGQSCNAPTRMLVPASRQAEAVAIAKAAAEKMKVGDPFGEGVKLGPVVSEAQFNKIQGLIQKGIDEGAQLVTGGVGRPEGLGIGFYVKPTVFAGVKNDMTIAREEIFGPVLTILPYETEEEAIAIANDTPYGLSGYVSSGDLDHARRVASRLRTGNVHLNGAQASFDAPFGGYKQSGNGREWGVNGFEEFLETKAVLGYAAKV